MVEYDKKIRDILMGEYDKERVYDLKFKKNRLISRLKELQAMERSNSMQMEYNTLKRDINDFYQYLLMRYENIVFKKDEANIFLKPILGINLKIREIILNYYFYDIDPDEFFMEAYNLYEQYKGLSAEYFWVADMIAFAEEKINDIRLEEENFTKQK